MSDSGRGARTKVPGAEPASGASSDTLTVAAIAVIAYAIANLLHEGLGHGGACWLVGGKPILLTSLHFEGDESGLAPWAVRVIASAGTLVDLAAAAVGLALMRALRGASVGTRYFLWLFVTVNAMQGTGYFLFSGLANIGDWAAVVSGLQPSWMYRVGLAVLGGVSYWFVVKWSMTSLGPFIGGAVPGRYPLAVPLTLIPYFTGALLYCSSGLLNPRGAILILISGMAASLGGTSGLAWGAQFLRGDDIRPSPTGPEPIPRSLAWIAAALAAALIFIAILGPGVSLHSATVP